MSDAIERLLAELAEASLGGTRSKRARLAVTRPEYQAVRRHLLAREGRFYGRVRNIPLIIDDDAASPPFLIERAEEIA